MAVTHRIVDGKLELTNTDVSLITREEVVARIAEVQTNLDHANSNVTDFTTEKTRWDNYLTEIDAA